MAIDTELVRLLVGDADADAQLLTDDQILAIVDGYSSNRMAAAAVAEAIAAKFSRKVSFSLQGLRFENSTKADAYRLLAQRLRNEANNESGALGAMVTGVSVGEEASVDDDADRTPSVFKTGMQQ